MRRTYWVWPALIFVALAGGAVLHVCRPPAPAPPDLTDPTSPTVTPGRTVLPTLPSVLLPTVTPTPVPPETLRTALPTLPPMTATLVPIPPPTLAPAATPTAAVQRG